MISSQLDNEFKKIIKKYYPDITQERITFFDDGWDHYVYVVDGEKAFRFPRGPEHGNKDSIETKFFEMFADMSPIAVQKMKLVKDEHTNISYETYKFVQGSRFTRQLAATFSEDELGSIAKKLGEFFTVLHAFPIDTARKMKMDSIVSVEDYADYWAGFLQHIQEDCYQYFSKGEHIWIENIFTEYVTTVKKDPYNLRVTHFDILPEHILVNEKTHTLAGIIDFSLRISDPAYDFSYLDRYGEKFLQIVLDNYPLSATESNFLLRRKFYAARLGFSFLSQALERQQEKVPEIVEQIHEYITEHV